MPELANVMNNVFDRLPECQYHVREGNIPVNIAESDNDYTIELMAPGYAKDFIKVEVDNNVLTISAQIEEKGEEMQQYKKREFCINSFKRSFTLPKNKIDDENIQANYENGVLTIILKKLEEAKPKPAKTITIS
jgi:HSP20 family protein